MMQFDWGGYSVTDSHINAAWWSSVVEPGDMQAAHIRAALGEEEARAWIMAQEPGPLPASLLEENSGGYAVWRQAFERWSARAHSAEPHAELGVLEGLGGRLVIPSDTQWPHALDVLGPGMPCALWVLGAPPMEGGVAIVGARASTQYGNYNARDLGEYLGQRHIPVISGGAFGVDIAAHRGALVTHGRTVAVMAGGVGELYPASHRQDFYNIIHSGGAIISEVPPMWRPARWRFLTRNRLIAALGRVTVVIEAGMRSGALSTARQAMELGRDVGAFPGMVTQEMSKGCHELIRNGATLVRNGDDVMELLSPIGHSQQGVLFGDPVEVDYGVNALAPSLRRVWETLPQRRGMALSTIVKESGLGERDVLGALAGLELAGLVGSSHGKWRRIVAK